MSDVGASAARARRALIAVVLISTAASLWPAREPWARASHPEGMPCATCHAAGDTVTADNARRLVASQERLCSGCHENALEMSHPSGVRASRTPPPDLPLGRDGHVTCSTCHEIHGARAGRLRSDRRGPEFCHSCHEPRFFAAMRDRGQSIVRKGHITAEPERVSLAVDPFSARCLECHEERSDHDRPRHGYSAVNHPVGKDYAPWLDYGGYRQPGAIPAAIRLPGGQVSCVSCHEGYARDHGKLVMANDRSQLCMGCHDL